MSGRTIPLKPSPKPKTVAEMHAMLGELAQSRPDAPVFFGKQNEAGTELELFECVSVRLFEDEEEPAVVLTPFPEK